VSTATNGKEALALIQQQQIDLVLLDLKMSTIDGFEVLKYTKQNFPAVKVVILTAYADLLHGMESKKYGADDFLSKPCNVEDLVATIERLLSA